MYTEAESKSLKDFIKKYIQAKTQPISNSSPEYMKKLARFKLPKTDNMNTNYVFKYID
jgi:hypothetical protein|nr:MAG TPA: hypothetical protein [Bacteriophage sp.]